MFAGILATKSVLKVNSRKSFPCASLLLFSSCLCECPEKGTVTVISQIDGCGRSQLAYWEGVILGDEEQGGILLPLRALSSLITEKHCVVSLNVRWDTALIGAESVILQNIT